MLPSSTVSLECVVSYRDAKPWPIRNHETSVLQREGFGEEFVSERIVLAVEFNDRLVEQRERIGCMRERRNGRDRMERRRDRDARPPDMRDRRHAIAFRQREDVKPSRKSACASKVRLS